MRFLTKEIRVVCRQLVQHGRDHIRVAAGKDIIHIGFKILESLGGKSVRKTAYDQLFLLAQVNSIMLLDIYIETLEILISQCQHLNHLVSFIVAC